MFLNPTILFFLFQSDLLGVFFQQFPLKDLNFKPGLLVAAIVHGGKLLIPGGHSIISEGDRVIVVAKSLFLKDLNDILVR